MFLRKFAKILAAVVGVSTASEAPEKEEHPRLQNWFEASWFDGTVKIPLAIDLDGLWYADLVVWNQSTGEYLIGGKCALDNNNPTTMILQNAMEPSGYPSWFSPTQGNCGTDTLTVTSDEAQYTGNACRQQLCLGSWIPALWDDPHTQVCNLNQYFMFVTSETFDWKTYYSQMGNINTICGLGKEPATSKSTSLISYAKYRGWLDQMIYSLEIAPNFMHQSAANSHKMFKERLAKINGLEVSKRRQLASSVPYVDQQRNSTLTIGGYDEDALAANITWFNTSQCDGCWNVPSSMIEVWRENDYTDVISPSVGTSYNVDFQTAYPYIGLNKEAFDRFLAQVTKYNVAANSPLVCDGDDDSGYLCYWAGTNCETLTLPNITIQLGTESSQSSNSSYYTIPVSQLVYQSPYDFVGVGDCDLYVTQLSKLAPANGIRLGDPFFSSFLPIFDVENDRLGLALAKQALDGSTWSTSPPVVFPSPAPPALNEEFSQ